jgi:hypothetical protein
MRIRKRGTGVIRKIFSERSRAKRQGSGGLAFQTKDILLTTSAIQERMASRAISHERVSGA